MSYWLFACLHEDLLVLLPCKDATSCILRVSCALSLSISPSQDLLERLEDKLEPEQRDLGLSQGLNEANEEMAGDAPQILPSWDSEYPRPESEEGFGRSNWLAPERAPAAQKSRLRGLFNSPRNLQRTSNCFGQRLDRVGSTSGLGCNRNRVRTGGREGGRGPAHPPPNFFHCLEFFCTPMPQKLCFNVLLTIPFVLRRTHFLFCFFLPLQSRS